jgi:uncharacterized protein YndB with AHSA1/START domain
MNNKYIQMITVQATINAPVSKVWECWNKPEHIVNWCFASDDWHAPRATNDLKVGSSYTTRMEAKDGSFGFDLTGIYDEIEVNRLIKYHLEDNRNVIVEFSEENGTTTVVEHFDPENENPHDMQQMGWQMILNNFKKYVESL